MLECRKESRSNSLTRSSDTAEVEMEPVAVKIKTQTRRPQPSFGTLNTMEEIPPVIRYEFTSSELFVIRILIIDKIVLN